MTVTVWPELHIAYASIYLIMYGKSSKSSLNPIANTQEHWAVTIYRCDWKFFCANCNYKKLSNNLQTLLRFAEDFIWQWLLLWFIGEATSLRLYRMKKIKSFLFAVASANPCVCTFISCTGVLNGQAFYLQIFHLYL